MSFVLLVLVLLFSIGVALVSHTSLAPHLAWISFDPERILKGEAWRFFLWPWIETTPFGLLFSLLSLYWFGKDLERFWGHKTYALYVLTMIMLPGVVISLLGWGMPWFRQAPLLGFSLVSSAVVMSWAFKFPERSILLFFISKLSGKQLVMAELVLTLLYTMYMGLRAMMGFILVQLTVLAYETLYKSYKQKKRAKELWEIEKRRLEKQYGFSVIEGGNSPKEDKKYLN